MQRRIRMGKPGVILAGILMLGTVLSPVFARSGKKGDSAGSASKVISLKSGQNGDQVIRTEVPERAAGQTHVLGLTAPKLDTVRVGFIGLGMRGPGAVERFTHIPGVKIVALCDKHADRVERSQKILEKAGFPGGLL
jgi:hypothetical protein